MRMALVAVVVVVGACASSEPLGIEDYVHSVEALSVEYHTERAGLTSAYLDELEARTAALQREADPTDAAAMAALSAEALDLTKRETAKLFASIGDALTRFAEGMESQAPPTAFESAHEEMLESLRLAADGVPGLLDAVAAADGFDVLDSAIAGSVFGDAQPRLEAACRRLEDEAATHELQTDLRCGQ